MTAIQTPYLKYHLSSLHLLVVALIIYLTHNPFVALVYLDVLLPKLLSLSSYRDIHNPTESQVRQINSNPLPSLAILYIHVFLSFLFVGWNFINSDILYPTTLSKVFGMYLVCYVVAPVIDNAHQLLHRQEIISRLLSRVVLVPLFFTYYPIEHIHVHHKQVGTEQDPITARRGQTMYSYFFNLIIKCHKLSFQIAPKQYLLGQAVQYLYLLAVYNKFGTGGLTGAIIFALLTHFIMETVEYIEHYGLIVRKPNDPVRENVSWNSDNYYWSGAIFNFQRHSDHHMFAYKLFPALALTPAMPCFPLSFMQITHLVVNPGAWFEFIHPLLDKIMNNQKLTEDDYKAARTVAQNALFKTKALVVGLTIYSLAF